MLPGTTGAFRLFRFSGINVYIHWSWFLVAYIAVQHRVGLYSSPIWNVAEYLGLFAIVLLHEFGHSLACRQVGGRADRIILWPLGGVAFVAPPNRPGAVLWSIAAGPLVNVVLAPVFFGAFWLTAGQHWWEVTWWWLSSASDAVLLLWFLGLINLVLLIFNLLPIYPLDGGQILRALLWFRLGPHRSLTIASGIGLVGALVLGGFAIYRESIWNGVLAAFVAFQAWNGWTRARLGARIAALPRRAGFACPSCLAAPPAVPVWLCRQCQQPFDAFATQAVCPQCGTAHSTTVCVHCGQSHPIQTWEKKEAGPTLPREPR